MWVFKRNDSSSFHCLISFTSESPCEPLFLLKKATSLQRSLPLRTERPATQTSTDSLVSCAGPTHVHISLTCVGGRTVWFIMPALSAPLRYSYIHHVEVKSPWEEAHQSSGCETDFTSLFLQSNVSCWDFSHMQRIIAVRVFNESPQRELSEKWKRPSNHREELKEASIRSLKVSIYSSSVSMRDDGQPRLQIHY